MYRIYIMLIAVLPLHLQAEEVPADTSPGRPESVEMPFRITSLLKGTDDEYKVGLVNDRSGDWKTLTPGDTFLGQRLLNVNYEEEYAEFDTDGEIIRMYLWGGNEKQDPPAQSQLLPDHPGYEVKLSPQPTTYTQTADELARGIDPNDPETWTEDYRGPAIERLANSVEQQKSLFKPTKPLTFEPTEDERARGIDPNDVSTWPDDYRGPGIERAAVHQPIRKDKVPFVLPEPPKGTPEEIRRRFLDLHTQPAGSREQE